MEKDWFFQTKEKLWKAVQACNSAWVNGNPQSAAVRQLFHPDVVMYHGSNVSTPVARGVDAMVQSFVDFTTYAATNDFKVLQDPAEQYSVEVFEDSAVVAYRFIIEYKSRQDGIVHREKGQEVLVFVKLQDDEWKVIWRLQTPSS